MIQTADVIAALVPYGIASIDFIPVEDTLITAIRITDQPYAGQQGHETLSMIAQDIIAPLGLTICGVASNARYEGDDAVGGVIHVRDLGGMS